MAACRLLVHGFGELAGKKSILFSPTGQERKPFRQTPGCLQKVKLSTGVVENHWHDGEEPHVTSQNID